MLQHYHDESCPAVPKALKKDAITFSVLIQIMQGRCTDIFTDHEHMVVCYSAPPYPVWVWCRDVENAADVEQIARCLKAKFPLEEGYAWNISRELMEKLKEADPYFCQGEEKFGLLSHRLDAIEEIHHPCDGGVTLAEDKDFAFLCPVWHDMAMEMEGHDLSREQCEERVRLHIDNKTLYLWRDGEGEITALTSKGDQGQYSKVSTVYTLPKHRRKGYAINLVHHVTQTILNDDRIPILYTNAAYAPSNDCYRKIGYKQVGSLCTVVGDSQKRN